MTSLAASPTGIFEVHADRYHADMLADGPTLSASLAHTLVIASPAHAKAAHPKLNPAYETPEDDPKYDIGRAFHSALLEGDDIVYVCQYDSWRTNEAKAARVEARQYGRVPLLAKKKDELDAMLEAAWVKLAESKADPPPLTAGKPEQSLVWEEQGVLCRARLDWLRDDFTIVEDIKTSSRSAHPQAFGKNLYGLGYDLKAAFYIRAVKALTGETPVFRWITIETSPPFELAVSTPGPDVLTLGDDKVDWALATWKACLASGEWPGYDRRVATLEMPPFEETRWLERKAA